MKLARSARIGYNEMAISAKCHVCHISPRPVNKVDFNSTSVTQKW